MTDEEASAAAAAAVGQEEWDFAYVLRIAAIAGQERRPSSKRSYCFVFGVDRLEETMLVTPSRRALRGYCLGIALRTGCCTQCCVAPLVLTSLVLTFLVLTSLVLMSLVPSWLKAYGVWQPRLNMDWERVRSGGGEEGIGFN